MAVIRLTGIFKEDIECFVELKRKCGYKYIAEEKILYLFDKFTVDRNEHENVISKELAREWSKQRPNESDAYRYKRCITLNQFAGYLSLHDRESATCYAPKPKKTFVPHIYTEDEMKLIFATCDNMECTPVRSDSIRFVMPALLRFLFSTGVRIGEALSLRKEDVKLDLRIAVLRDTKNGKERLLPFSESMENVLRQYIRHRDRLNPNPLCDKFFLSARGRECSSEQIYKVFRKILSKTGIPFKGNHYGPRVHDFRHTFAVKSLLKMADSGMDIYCSLRILSTYLGHQSIEATNNYVRLTVEMYPHLVQNVDAIFTNVYPSLRNEDN